MFLLVAEKKTISADSRPRAFVTLPSGRREESWVGVPEEYKAGNEWTSVIQPVIKEGLFTIDISIAIMMGL